MTEVKTLHRHDLAEKQGSTIHIAFPVETADGQKANLNGWAARCQIRDIVTDELLYTVSGMSIDIPNAYAVMHIPSDVSAAFTWKLGKYDIELYNTDNPPIVIPLVQGKFRLIKESTK